MRPAVSSVCLLALLCTSSAITNVRAAEPGIRAVLSRAAGKPARLILGHWPDKGWSVQQFERNVEIRFAGAPFEIDRAALPATGIPGLIAQTATDQRPDGTVLLVSLDCNCSVALHGNAETGLLIDVLALDRQVGVDTGPAPLSAPVPRAKRPREPDPDQVALGPSGGKLDVAAARDHLMQQLLRAADAGIVTLDPKHARAENPDQGATNSASDTEVDTAEAAYETKASEAVPEVEQSKEIADQDQAIETAVVGRDQPAARPGDQADPARNVANALDAETPESDHHADATTDAPLLESEDAGNSDSVPTCHPNEVFSFDVPHTRDNIVLKISEHRKALIGEFDRPDQDVAINLAKLYISVGLETEASAVLTAFAPDHPLGPVYMEIANLIGGRPLTPGADLLHESCLGDQALWRAFAHAIGGNNEASLQAERASGRALERLDSDIRERVAAQIGLAATELSEWSVARRMEAMALRAGSSQAIKEPETLLLQSRLSRWNGETEKAIALLHRLRRWPNALNDEALLTFGDMVVSGEANLDDAAFGLKLDLGALARDQRGEPIGVRAFDLEARLTDKFSSREAAIELLELGVEAGHVSPDGFVDRVTQLAAKEDGRQDSRPLALIYLDDPERLAPALEQQAFRRALTASMAAIGTPGLVRPILRDGDLDDPEIASSLAESFLDAGEPREALDIAGYLPAGPLKRRIMSESLLAAGQPDQAIRVLPEAASASEPEEDQARAKAALAAEDWMLAMDALARQLEDRPDPEVADQLAIAAMRAGLPDIPEAARQVLAETDAARLARLEALFAADLPDTPDNDPSAVTGFLDNVDAETAAIREILDDG